MRVLSFQSGSVMSAMLALLLALIMLTGTNIQARSIPNRPPFHHLYSDVIDTDTAAAIDSDACNGDDYGSAGQFDFYVLAQSWSAEFCYAHSSYPGCQQPTDWMRANLTIHGLWPQYSEPQSSHNYPQCCTQEPLAQSTVDQLLSPLQLYWPNEESPDGQPLSESLWYHEWAKHGTCAGVDQLSYMSLVLTVGSSTTAATPSIIHANSGKTVKLSVLSAAYRNGAVFLCDGKYLTEVHQCFTKSGEWMTCPSIVRKDAGMCKSSTVSISQFK